MKDIKLNIRSLNNWIISNSYKASKEQQIYFLAFVKLCQLHQGTWNKDVKEHIINFLKPIDNFLFAQSELLISILACELIIELGSDKQRNDAENYILGLKEISNELKGNTYNEILLQTIFNDHTNNKNSTSILLNIDPYVNNIKLSIEQVLKKIEILSLFGTEPVNIKGKDLAVLEGMALYSQRGYDLSLSLRCLRARNYVTKSSSLIEKTILDYVLLQQQNEGCFGYYEGVVLNTIDKKQREKIVFELILKTSLQSVWTFYELKGNNLCSYLKKSNNFKILSYVN